MREKKEKREKRERERERGEREREREIERRAFEKGDRSERVIVWRRASRESRDSQRP